MLESFIDRLTRASLRFKWVTIGLTLIVLIAGVLAIPQLKQELIPGIEFPQSVILAFGSGLDSQTLLDEVTIPIEDAIRDVEGVVNIESTTSSGVSVVIVRNEIGEDVEALRAELNKALSGLEYPEGMDVPELLTFSLSDLPIAAMSVSSPGLSLMDLKDLVEVEIIPALVEIEDVADVQVSGGQELPTPPPAIPEPTPEPEPTLEPTPEPTEMPVEATAAPDEGPEAVDLPEAWVQAAAMQGLTISTTDDLSPVLVGAIANLAPQLLNDLTAEMLLAMPLDALEVLPQDYLETLEPELAGQLADRLAVTQVEITPVDLPDSWIQAAASQGIDIATTDDLTAIFIGGIASFAPEFLDDLTPEMLLAMPVDALTAIPESYLSALDPELGAKIAERLTSVQEPDETNLLPETWQFAGETLGITLTTPQDVTQEILQGIVSFAPQMLDELTPEHLRQLSADVLAWLPTEFVDSLDPDLRDELNELAQSAGGLGHLAAQAEAETEDMAADAPELSGAWRATSEDSSADGPTPSFETAADLINSGFASSAAELLNLLVQRGLPEDAVLMHDLSPAVITWLTENESDFLENLSPAALRLLSPEVLGELPEDFLSSLDSGLRAELEGIAAGTVEAFIPTNTLNRVNGSPSLALMVFKDGEANTVSVSHAVFDKLDELEAVHAGLQFDVVFEQSSFIEESISGVAREGGLGALFAVVVILIFLSGYVKGKYRLSWQSTFVTAVSIPLSVFMAFALFKWLPPFAALLFDPLVSATEDINILGDVVIAFQRLFPVGLTLNIMTLSGMTVAIGRVVDDSIVVLENIYRHIQRGEDMRESVLKGTRDVAIAIFASTVTTVVVFLPIGMLGGIVGGFFMPFGVAVTYALASSFLVAVTIVPLLAFLFIRKEHLPTEAETVLQKAYTPLLQWALKNRVLTLVVAGVLLAGSMVLLSQRPRAFLPSMGEVRITVSVDLPNGATMAETDAKVAEFERELAKIENVGTISSEIGSGGGLQARFFGAAIDQGAASIDIGVENTDDIDALTADVRQEAEAVFGPDNTTVSGGTLTSSAFGSFALVLSGDPDELKAFNDEAIGGLEEVEGLTNVSSNLTDPDLILRVDGEPAVRYTGELETQDTLGVTQSAKAVLESLVPTGLKVSEGFETQMQTEGFSQSMRAVMISILVVYLVMVITFRSFVHPFTILFSLPLAIIGAAVALWITDRVVGISVLVGLMMLVGIVVTNAIVLIDRVQANRKKRGMNAHDSLLEGGRTRLRPILMTAIAAMLALVPMALGLTEGALIAAELATVVIGGLFTSTLLTLLVVPVMYSILDRFTRQGAKVLVSTEDQ